MLPVTNLYYDFLRRHYPYQVQGDLELHFVPISAEDALSAPVFIFVNYISFSGVNQEIFYLHIIFSVKQKVGPYEPTFVFYKFN